MPTRRTKSKKRTAVVETRKPQRRRGGKALSAKTAMVKKAAVDYKMESSSVHEKNTRHFDIPLFVGFTTMFGYAILTVFGHIRDFFGRLLSTGRYFGKKVRSDVAPLVQSSENFYDRRMYHRIQDVFNRPITGPPGANGMKVLERQSTDSNFSFKQTGKTLDVINLGSYNYLGVRGRLARDVPGQRARSVRQLWRGSLLCTGGRGLLLIPRTTGEDDGKFFEQGVVHRVQHGLRNERDHDTVPMGKGSLIISDSLNHTSIVNGVRAAGSSVKVFKHDDPVHLEQVLRKAIVEGQPGKNRPWRKILVICEGVYSMEGEISHLKEIVDVCKKYKAYVYLDEAHSIGAMGATGRGITEHAGVDTADVDVMMGTFTKSFGGMGGYIAGSKDLIDHIRKSSSGSIYCKFIATRTPISSTTAVCIPA